MIKLVSLFVVLFIVTEPIDNIVRTYCTLSLKARSQTFGRKNSAVITLLIPSRWIIEEIPGQNTLDIGKLEGNFHFWNISNIFSYKRYFQEHLAL